MNDTSPRLSLPLLQPSQAQKHVTHNAALERLDVLVQLVVEAFDATTPPVLAEEGQVWALGTAPQSAWAGQASMLAAWRNGGWLFVAPQEGWQAVARTAAELRIWTGTAWVQGQTTQLGKLNGVGIGTDFDAVNRLSVASDAALFSHAGAGHQLKVNKATDTDTASLLFQTGFSGRAEMGTAGSDDFEVKVSADGTTWFTGLQVAADSGEVSAPAGLTVDGQITGTAVQAAVTDTTSDVLLRMGAGGLLSNWPTWTSDLDALEHNQMATASSGSTNIPPEAGNWSVLHQQMRADEASQIAIRDLGSIYVRTRHNGTWRGWQRLWTTDNTTVDANGFIKEASPILRLARDGVTEPVEPVGAQFGHADVGHYTLSGIAPLARSGWQVEVPKDHNGNRLIFVTTDYDAAERVLTVRTATVTWDSDTGLWAAGTPVDIPEGRWVDLRLDKADETAGT